MALILLESFDHFTASQGTAKGWSANPASMQTGRFGGQAARSGNGFGKSLPASYSTVICGFAYRVQASGGGDTGTFFSIQTTGGGDILKLSLNSGVGGHIVVNNGSGVVATGTTAINANIWYYIEVKLVVNGASGTCQVNINGAAEIASTTGNFGSTNAGIIKIDRFNSGTTRDWDDIYVCDTTGSTNNTFLGDCRVVTLFPDGAGASTQWTHNGAGSNYLCVNETTPDDDTTYVSDVNVGDIDLYTFGDIVTGATVFGTQCNVYARKDDASVRQIAMMSRQSGTNYTHSTKTLASTYAFYSDLHDQDPTGSNWTPANINADQFGVKVIA